MRSTGLIPVFLGAAAFAACATDVDPTDGESGAAISMPAADAQRVLDLVNYPGTDAKTLDTTIALDARAAKAIIAARNGADGVAPSADDVSFATIAQLDAVAYVGDSALYKLEQYANAHPAPAGATVEGVVFTGWQEEAVVWGVNRASIAELDADVKLDARAAANLVAKAPFANVGAMGPVAQVGKAALTALRAHAGVWWARMHATTPPACDLTFTVVAPDADTADLNELIDDATTLDYPAAEIVTLQIPPCALTDETQRARIVPNLPYLPTGVIHWGIDVTVLRPTASALGAGGASYVADVNEITDLIDGRGWQPSDPRQQDLYARMASLIASVTGGPASNPSGYVESLMKTDADECSESAAVLIDTSNGRVSIIHFYPRC